MNTFFHFQLDSNQIILGYIALHMWKNPFSPKPMNWAIISNYCCKQINVLLKRLK